MDIIPEEEKSYTTECQDCFLKYVENEYCAKHQRMSIILPKNVPQCNNFPSAKASGFGQSSVNPCDKSNDDEEY